MGIHRPRRTPATRVLAAAALLGSLVIDVGPVGAALPGRNGPIVCTSSRDGNTDVISFNPDGSDVRRLTSDPAEDFGPTPSPDGTKVAFTGTQSGDPEIYIMNQDGSGLRRLTFAPGEDRAGSFSPDGTQLSFHSGRFPVSPGPGHSGFEIMTMRIDGSDVRRLTNNSFDDRFSRWSPQGDRVSFTTDRDGDLEVYTLVPVDANADGNADVQTRVTNSTGDDSHGSWSPDGGQLMIHSRRNAEVTPDASEVYRVSSVDGAQAVRLTSDDTLDAFPAWSPDGQKVVWSRFVPGEAFVANATDGDGRTNVTNTVADDTDCDWGRLLPCTVTGSGTIVGTGGDDVVCGSSGSDRIVTMGGNDVIYAGDGNDRIDAGAGKDIVFAGRGDDTVAGGDGDDTLFGDQGSDQISAGAGHDMASGGEDADQVAGGEGFDECYGESMIACDTSSTLARAAIGVAYPFQLYTHCGILGTFFDGREWRADPPQTQHGAGPPPGWRNPIQAGSMTLVSSSVAEFKSPDGVLTARFVPRQPGSPDLPPCF